MSHRVHTILSILAEDHAPAALRPSILLTIDWPTVAEEAPATGDDSYIAYIAAGLLGGRSTRDNLVSSLWAIASLAARLATVAASLTATGDKAMTTHATALWGAAAALVGMPVGIDSGIRATLVALAIKAADIVPGVVASGPDEKATLIATALDRVREYRNNGTAEAFGRGVKIRAALGIMPGEDILGALAILRETLSTTNNINIMSAASMQAENLNLARQGRDRALADIHALRDILKVPEGGNLVDHASKTMDEFPRGLLMAAATMAAKLTGATVSVYPAEQAGIIGEALRIAEAATAENTRLRAQVDRMIAAMREDAPATVKPRPQPGDVVPWTEVEDGALYFVSDTARFRMSLWNKTACMFGPDDPDLEVMLRGRYTGTPAADLADSYPPPTLVARNLGTDLEAWRKAMREWTASESSRPR